MDGTLKSLYQSCSNRMRSACWRGMEKVTGLHYNTAKIFAKFRLHHSNKSFNGPPLLIYSMGKVGSQTVQETLKSAKLEMPSYHIHHLTHDYIDTREKRYKEFFYDRDDNYTDFDMLWRLQFLRDELDKSLSGNKWKIVSLVRDPVAVNISTFFHHFNHIELLGSKQKYRVRSLYYDFEVTVGVEDTDLLLDLFLKRVDHDSPLSFFDDEVKRVFSIDVYACEFSKSKGYQTYYDNKADLLVIRLENLNDCAESAFNEFLDIKRLELIHTNIGSRKSYAPIYKAFKNAVIMPDTYINQIYSSKFMRHFYSDDEINEFKLKWTSGKVRQSSPA